MTENGKQRRRQDPVQIPEFDEKVITDDQTKTENYSLVLNGRVTKLWADFLEQEGILHQNDGYTSDADYGKLTEAQAKEFVNRVYQNYGFWYLGDHKGINTERMDDAAYNTFMDDILGFQGEGLEKLLQERKASNETLDLVNQIAFTPLQKQLQTRSLHMLSDPENAMKLAEIIVKKAKEKNYELASSDDLTKAKISQMSPDKLMVGYIAITKDGMRQADRDANLEKIGWKNLFKYNAEQPAEQPEE